MKTIVADDHPIVLSALADLLRLSGHQVVGTARAGDEALRLITTLRPDVAILDVVMPGQTGVEVIQQLRSIGDPTPVVLLTGALDDDTLVQAIRLGVDGLVLKDTATDLLLRCLQVIEKGEKWIDREAMARGLQLLAQEESGPHLTPRETQILALVTRGLKNREIADQLAMSEGTVKAHLSSIFDKIGVKSRTELLVRARDLRLT